MCELKTKHFKAVCPYTNSEMEISILCQRIHKTQTLNKHYKKWIFHVLKSLNVLMEKEIVHFSSPLKYYLWHRFIRCFFDVSRFFSI